MWQCRIHNKDGQRCSKEAVARIHFSNDHPFDHTDVCEEHMDEYKVFCWVQFDLQHYGLQ